MFSPPTELTEEDYKKEFLAGQHQTDYNKCRFAEDKLAYAKEWMRINAPWVNYENPRTIADIVGHEKIYFDSNPLKFLMADKLSSIFYGLGWNDMEDPIFNMPELVIPPAKGKDSKPLLKFNSYLTDEVWENIPEDVPLILRMSHGSGWNFKFIKTKDFDPSFLQAQTFNWHRLNYAYMCGWERQYEPLCGGFLIQPDLGKLMNWEFWCVDGKIEGINLIRKLGKNFEENVAFVNEDGRFPKWYIGKPMMMRLSPSQMEILEKMKPYVKKLAEPFKFVRVDMYSINGEPKFSELTFTPCAGRIITSPC